MSTATNTTTLDTVLDLIDFATVDLDLWHSNEDTGNCPDADEFDGRVKAILDGRTDITEADVIDALLGWFVDEDTPRGFVASASSAADAWLLVRSCAGAI